jgi:PRTRC genetic system protein A
MATTFLDYHVVTAAGVPPLEALRDYLIGANGVFLRSRRPELEVCLPVPGPAGLAPIFGLGSVTPSFSLRRPRIPASLIATMLDQAQTARLVDGRAAEILFYVRWEEDAWRLIVPEQDQQHAAVQPIGQGIADGDGVFLEAHSHHAWTARFSPTDDADEQGFARCYAVLGTVFTTPAMRCRIQFYGHRWEIPAPWLMELPEGLTDALVTPAWTEAVRRWD